MTVPILKGVRHLDMTSEGHINCKRAPKQNLDPTVLFVYVCVYICKCEIISYLQMLLLKLM